MNRSIKTVLAAVLVFCLLLTAVAPVFAAQSSPFADSAFYTQGDYSIHYRVLPAQGVCVGQIFFIHGMMSSTVYWEPMAKILNENGYTCVLADLPGFGYSTREDDAVSPIAREALMTGLMAYLAPGEPWIVAGHSMGGGVALNLATQYPDLVQSLLLYAPAGGGGAAQNNLPAFLLRAFGHVLNLVAKILPRIEPAVRLFFAQASAESMDFVLRYDLSRITDPLLLPNTGSSLLYMAQRTTAVDLQAAAQLEIPILLVWGEKDSIVTQEGSVGLQAALTNATVRVVDSGHMFAETRAEETAALTLEFLRR